MASSYEKEVRIHKENVLLGSDRHAKYVKEINTKSVLKRERREKDSVVMYEARLVIFEITTMKSKKEDSHL